MGLKQVGTIKRTVGIKGYIKLEKGAPVYEKDGLYILKMSNGTAVFEVTYLKKSLTWRGQPISPEFTDIIELTPTIEEVKITPLQSHWEYIDAKTTMEAFVNKYQLLKKLSEQDEREFLDLKSRVELYESSPTPVNIIEHTKGNVFKTLP